eukprot:scaffold394_cov112-Isochrysis_galbana.AAC.4
MGGGRRRALSASQGPCECVHVMCLGHQGDTLVPAFVDSQPPQGRARARSTAPRLQCAQVVCWGASVVVSTSSACLGVRSIGHGRFHRLRLREADRAIGRPGWAPGAI